MTSHHPSFQFIKNNNRSFEGVLFPNFYTNLECVNCNETLCISYPYSKVTGCLCVCMFVPKDLTKC